MRRNLRPVPGITVSFVQREHAQRGSPRCGRKWLRWSEDSELSGGGAGQRTGHFLSSLRKTPFSIPQEMGSRWIGLKLVFIIITGPLETCGTELEVDR